MSRRSIDDQILGFASLSPSDAAELLGFESVEAMSAWLGGLSFESMSSTLEGLGWLP